MTGLLFAPIEVFMNKELVIILMEILRLYEDEDYQPKNEICKTFRCPNVYCECCPLSDDRMHHPDDSFVAQIHKSMETIS